MHFHEDAARRDDRLRRHLPAYDIGKAFVHQNSRERKVLVASLRFECFDHREIAQILRMGTASIRPMLARARASFRDVLRRRGIGN